MLKVKLCVCVCVYSTSLYAEVTVCPLGRWKRRKLLELLSRHVEGITPTYFSVKVSVECFSKSSAAFTNSLYLLRGFIYHFESDHAVCFLHFTCCSVLSHQLWCSVFRQKKEAIWSVWGTLVRWSTLCQINRDCSAICYCCSTSPQYHGYEVDRETLVTRAAYYHSGEQKRELLLHCLFFISVMS